MKHKLCIIYNTAPRYREAIFQAIDKEYDCDWYFGKTKSDIKEMDLSLLNNTQYYDTFGKHNSFYWKRGIIQLLFRKKYKTFLMLSESRSLTDYIFLGLSRLLKKRVYVWTHGWYGKETIIEAALKRWQFNRADGIFVYSNYGRNLLIQQGIPANKIFTIHNSLHYDQQRTIRENMTSSNIYREYFGNEYPTIIFIGRLTKAKKLDMLIDALVKLRTERKRFNLVIVGDGTERNCLQKKVDSEEFQNNVWFYGACYDELLNAELVYNADLCVAPGNIGLTAMHAMVFGCPCISHNSFEWQMPEFEAITPGSTGDFFEMDNVNALAYSINNWFAKNGDKRDIVRKACFNEIDTNWNPYFQIDVIKKNLIIE